MDTYINLWKSLNDIGVRYILVGGFAAYLYGCYRFTGNIDLYLEDTFENGKKLRQSLKDYGLGDFELIERIEFIPGLVDFHLDNNFRMTIITFLKGVSLTFDECLQIAPVAEIEGVKVPFLHINQLIDNKRAVNRPKDQSDVRELERIRSLPEKR